MPAKTPRAYNFAVPSKIVLWQHVGDLRPLGVMFLESRLMMELLF